MGQRRTEFSLRLNLEANHSTNIQAQEVSRTDRLPPSLPSLTLPQAQIGSTTLANNYQTSRKAFIITFCHIFEKYVASMSPENRLVPEGKYHGKQDTGHPQGGLGCGLLPANLLEVTWSSAGRPEPGDLVCGHSRPPVGRLGEEPHALVYHLLHEVQTCLTSCITSHSRSGSPP